MYASKAMKFGTLGSFRHFSKYLKYLRNFEKWSKLNKNLSFFASKAYTTLSHHFELSYSRIKIDHIADSLVKLQIKMGVHLISVELSQFLTLEFAYRVIHFALKSLDYCWASY